MRTLSSQFAATAVVMVGLGIAAPAAATAATIDVDATALDYVSIQIDGGTPLTTTSPHSLTLSEGPHTLRYPGGGNIPFAVDAAGNVGYDASFEGFLSGAGTSVLAVDGYAITIDAAAVDYIFVDITWLGAHVSTSVPETLHLLPDLGASQHDVHYPGGSPIRFTIDANGNVGYDPGYEDFFSGAGTSTLTLDGFDVSVDVSALDYVQIILDWLEFELDLSGPQVVTLLPDVGPGTHALHSPGGTHIPFTIDADGNVGYDAGFEDFFSGAGTGALTVEGFDVTVDVSALDYADVIVTWIAFDLDLTGPQTLTLLPDVGTSSHSVHRQAGPYIPFTVSADGLTGYDPSFEAFFSGAGTTGLTVDGCAITIDARALAEPTFILVWVGTFPTATPVEVRLLPDIQGSDHDIRVANTPHLFQVTDECVLDIPPEEVGYFFGQGTATLSLGSVNDPPTAVAGADQSIHAGQTVNLDGTGSFDDQTATAALGYAWAIVTKPAGSSAALTDAFTASPSFVADLPGAYTVQLVVTDEESAVSAPDVVAISSTNVGPTADAGVDRVVPTGSSVVLDGSASTDPEFDPLTFAWTLTSAPAGSIATLGAATTATPALVPDVEGSYVVSLVVSDGFVTSAIDTVEIVGIAPDVFASQMLREACDYVAGLPNDSFDAQGHRKSMCNEYASISKFLQKGQLASALAHLSGAIERVDGYALRGIVDPKGETQPHAADYLVITHEQGVVYALLTAAQSALQ